MPIIRRALTVAAVALAAIYGAAIGHEAARCLRIELEHWHFRRRTGRAA